MPPAAGDAGWDPKVNPPFVAGAGAPNANGDGWLNVDGLLGAEPGAAGCPNEFEVAGAPKEKAVPAAAVADVGVALKVNPPPEDGREASSAGFVWPKLNEVDIEGAVGATAWPNPPNVLGSSGWFSLAANGFEVVEPKAKGVDAGAGVDAVCPVPNKPTLGVELEVPNENAPPPMVGLDSGILLLACCNSLVGLSSILNSLS